MLSKTIKSINLLIWVKTKTDPIEQLDSVDVERVATDKLHA